MFLIIYGKKIVIYTGDFDIRYNSTNYQFNNEEDDRLSVTLLGNNNETTINNNESSNENSKWSQRNTTRASI